MLREGFPPGPPMRKGLVSSARYFWRFATDALGFVGERFATYGDIYYAANGSGGLFVLRRPEHLHEVLVTRAAAYGKEHTAFKQLSRVLGEGLLISDGENWTRHRRMINPGFSPAKMAAYGDVMVEEARKTAARWRDGDDVSIDKEMASLTLRIVSRTLFGHDVSRDDMDAIARTMEAAQQALLRWEIVPEWIPLPGRRALERAIADLDTRVYRLIRDRRNERRGDGSAPRSDLLQLLVDAVDTETPANLTEREVRDELVTLFLAGHETTSQALTWTFYCLARAPAAERALHAELRTVLGDREPTFDDLERLPYTEQVILEAMRVYPPVYLIARRAREDTEVGGYRIPRGAEVVCWVYWTHRDPVLYPEPEAFRPERFEKAAIARPAEARVPSVRCRTTSLHRQGVRDDGSATPPRDPRAAPSSHPRSEQAAGACPGEDHADAKGRYRDARRGSPDSLVKPSPRLARRDPVTL